ncbi:MAG: GIY-YIG nuclease family protein [Alphaproteobacteria bacterium]
MDGLLRLLASLARDSAGASFVTDPASLPSGPGAYVLVIDLARPCALPIPAPAPATLDAGRYFYVGSARGPGGIRARVARHMRRGKALCWHIDRLTEAGKIAGALVLPGGAECAALERLLGLPGLTVPVPGFGSSDCARCPAHLLAAPARLAPDRAIDVACDRAATPAPGRSKPARMGPR